MHNFAPFLWTPSGLCIIAGLDLPLSSAENEFQAAQLPRWMDTFSSVCLLLLVRGRIFSRIASALTDSFDSVRVLASDFCEVVCPLRLLWPIVSLFQGFALESSSAVSDMHSFGTKWCVVPPVTV